MTFQNPGQVVIFRRVVRILWEPISNNLFIDSIKKTCRSPFNSILHPKLSIWYLIRREYTFLLIYKLSPPPSKNLQYSTCISIARFAYVSSTNKFAIYEDSSIKSIVRFRRRRSSALSKARCQYCHSWKLASAYIEEILDWCKAAQDARLWIIPTEN